MYRVRVKNINIPNETLIFIIPIIILIILSFAQKN